MQFKQHNGKTSHLRGNPIWKITMCLVIGGLYAQSVAAHPHYWISLKADMILDEQGRLSKIRQQWAFDVYFSMMTVKDVVNEHGDKQTGLRKIADQIIDNLSKFHYFSTLTVDGAEVILPQPSSYQLNENTQLEQPILELEILFDMASPVIIQDKNVVWSVFDPTYYIAMNYSTAANVSIQGDNADQCELQLDLPDLSRELMEYAQSLDRSQKDINGLGIKFAEKIRINCS